MKIVKFIILVSFVLGAVFSYSSNCFAQERICSVDLLRVFDKYNKRKDFDEELEAVGKESQAQRSKLIDELKEIQDKITLLSEKEKGKKQKELTEKSRELQEFDQKISIDLRKDWDEKLRGVFEDVRKTVEGFAKREKCAFVIDSKALLYGDKKSDITGEIIKILNKKYKK